MNVATPLEPPAGQLLGKWQKWVVLCGFWALPAFFEVFQYYFSLTEQGMGPTWSHAILRGSVRWGLWALLTPAILALARRVPLRLGLVRVVAIHVIAGAAVTALQLTAVAVVFEFTFYNAAFGDRGWSLGYTIYRVLLNSFGISLTAYWFIIAAYYAFDYYREAQERAVAAARLEASLSQTRLEALRLQLNPHFLFNTLHVISTLSREGNQRGTTRMIMLLSDLLRLTLRRSGQTSSLADELDHAAQYLEIEKVRFEDNLTISVDIDADALDAEVPCFLLQPILENAVRYGLSSTERGIVSIRGHIRCDRLVLTVWNSGRPPAGGGSPSGLGIGLSNISERLRCLYGTDYKLELTTMGEGGAVTTIDLPLTRTSAASMFPEPTRDRHGALSSAVGDRA